MDNVEVVYHYDIETFDKMLKDIQSRQQKDSLNQITYTISQQEFGMIEQELEANQQKLNEANFLNSVLFFAVIILLLLLMPTVINILRGK